jgi:hypothetical protein
MYTRQYKTKKAAANSSETTATNQFAPRRFVAQPSEEITNHQTPDLQTQLNKEKESGNNLRNIPLFPRNATQPQPPRIQMKLTSDLPLQAKGDLTGNSPDSSVEQRPNQTGMPDALKTGVESLSGYSLDDVRVHYNSPKPAQLQALAYTQGTEIHVASGQEEHLPHEAWHVVQQAQGRVQPTMQMKDGVSVNDDAGLEREADVMGAKALAPAAQRAGGTEYEALLPDTFEKAQIAGGHAEAAQMQGKVAIQRAVIQAIPDGTYGVVTIELASGKKYTGGGTLKDHEDAGAPTYLDCSLGNWPTSIDIKKPPKGQGPISEIKFTSVKGKYTFTKPNYLWQAAWEGPRVVEI